jgi:hypothetical protein
MMPWGVLAADDLHGCEQARPANPDTARRFVPAVNHRRSVLRTTLGLSRT